MIKCVTHRLNAMMAILAMYGCSSSDPKPVQETKGPEVTTFAGIPEQAGNQDGSLEKAQFWSPTGIEVDDEGNIYLTDTGNGYIRKISTSGTVSTVAGNGSLKIEDGIPGGFSEVQGIALDNDHSIFVTDKDLIRMISNLGEVSTIAGQPNPKLSEIVDGPGSESTFILPVGLVVTSANVIYVADNYHNAVRKIVPPDPAGSGEYIVSTVATDIDRPKDVVIDASGNLFVSSRGSIVKITPGGIISTFAGSNVGYQDALGDEAKFRSPAGMDIDADGNIYVADYGNNMIRKISSSGLVTTVAGRGVAAFADGSGIEAQFSNPVDLKWVDGILYVVDQGNHCIRKIVLEP